MVSARGTSDGFGCSEVGGGRIQRMSSSFLLSPLESVMQSVSPPTNQQMAMQRILYGDGGRAGQRAGIQARTDAVESLTLEIPSF